MLQYYYWAEAECDEFCGTVDAGYMLTLGRGSPKKCQKAQEYPSITCGVGRIAGSGRLLPSNAGLFTNVFFQSPVGGIVRLEFTQS